jgi:hypothetical protein
MTKVSSNTSDCGFRVRVLTLRSQYLLPVLMWQLRQPQSVPTAQPRLVDTLGPIDFSFILSFLNS